VLNWQWVRVALETLEDGFMVNNYFGKAARALLIASLVAVGSSGGLNADDTEIYQATFSPGGTGGRPNVLIIFDDSGSMNTDVLLQPPAYDPTAVYPLPASSSTDAQIYWSVYDPDPDVEAVPPAYDTPNYFPASINRCAESYSPLATVGVFSSRAVGWQSDTKEWDELATDAQHVDCLVDVVNANPSNGAGQGNGYPKEPAGVYTAGEELSAATPGDSDLDWAREYTKVYTFYSAHYMGYLEYVKTPAVLVSRTRLDIAKEAVKTVIAGNPGIDFGLALFNSNTPDWFWTGTEWIGTDVQARSGGRIAKRILESDDASARAAHRTSLGVTVDAITSNGWTPLCESTYEAYRYLAGLGLVYGDQLDTSVVDGVVTDTPGRDSLAENPAGTYESPATDCSVTYVILMTDGLPTFDTDANARIKTLTGATSCNTYQDDYYETSENCLPELAAHMATEDLDNDASNGEQISILSTIGFTTDQSLLSDAASNGGGRYFTAVNAAGLAAALQGAVANSLAQDVSFTSPSVAVDSFTRTQSRDDVFFSMFNPERRIDWPGNIKKLKLSIDATVCAPATACLVDKNVDPAINIATGAIESSASTYWSNGDGGIVDEGGVGALLAARDLTGRTLLTNTATTAASGLEAFNSTNLDATGFGYADDATLFAKFGVSDQTELNAIISWGQGYDVMDEDKDSNVTENRPWILADMLHSKPLVINYGATGSTNVEDGTDLRILVGTNGGFLHMFNNKLGDENWAFFPKELAQVLAQRAANPVSNDHVYGIDGSPVLYSKDVDHDGTIDDSDGDIAWVYFGLRRGGRGLYALDLSDPDDPKLKWSIDQSTTGFGELGQTWSDPVVTRIPGYVDVNGVAKPVLVFGAGYDPINDGSGLASASVDTMGRGLFIVDAADGTLLWSVTPAADTTTNLQETGLVHSVAGMVRPLDSNGDELTDRIYFADTGGNIWRVDMPGSLLPNASNPESDTWRIVKLAAINGGTAATDRRFFNAPDVVRTSYAGSVFDAVLIGSGDRTNPNGTDVDNQFYMLKDKQILPYFTAAPSSCPADPYDFRCDLPLNSTDPAPADPNDPSVPDPFLYDATDNLAQQGTAGEKDAALKLLAKSNGWFMDLEASGEKSLSSSLTIAGSTYFGTFSPASNLANMCEPATGTGRLHVVKLLNAAAGFDFDPNTSFERSWIIGSLIPDTPSVHIDEEGVIRLLLPPGSGGGGNMSNPFLTGATLPDPYGEYWYREEY
jgi:type IV pilus assembly protein PilY1